MSLMKMGVQIFGSSLKNQIDCNWKETFLAWYFIESFKLIEATGCHVSWVVS